MVNRSLLFLASALLLVSCTQGSGGGDGDDDNSASFASVAYYPQAREVLQTYCTRCHYDGGPGYGNFDDPEEAVEWASAMIREIDDGRMPPPTANPACADYQNSARMSLPPEARDLLLQWVKGGTPVGDPADAVEVVQLSTLLPDPDLELRMPTPYTPLFQDWENPGNEYRCFALDHGRDDDFFIQSYAPIIDEAQLVHHVVLFTMSPSALPGDYDPDLGFNCINGGTNLQGMLAGWAPGMQPLVLDDGLGLRVSKDDLIVLQMHYFYSGTETEGLSDQSGYSFKTADSVDREVYMAPFGNFDFHIPAGAEDHSETTSIPIPLGLTIWATFPHMHILGSGYRFWANHSDGTETCIAESDAWDFNHQQTYQLLEPIELEAGDSASLSCTWNNSDSNADLIHHPPLPVEYGERTDEEMCFSFTLASLSSLF